MSPDKAERMQALRENGSKSVRIDAKGRMFLDGEEFLYPIVMDSIEVRRLNQRNLLTLTLVVGEVTMERRKPRASCSNPECGTIFYGPPGSMPTQCDHCGADVEVVSGDQP